MALNTTHTHTLKWNDFTRQSAFPITFIYTGAALALAIFFAGSQRAEHFSASFFLLTSVNCFLTDKTVDDSLPSGPFFAVGNGSGHCWPVANYQSQRAVPEQLVLVLLLFSETETTGPGIATQLRNVYNQIELFFTCPCVWYQKNKVEIVLLTVLFLNLVVALNVRFTITTTTTSFAVVVPATILAAFSMFYCPFLAFWDRFAN